MKPEFEQPIYTDRLTLKPFCATDAENLFLLNSDPEVMRYTGDKMFLNMEAARKLAAEYSANNYEKYGFGRWMVFRTSDDAFLGWNGLKMHADGTVDLGYRFLRKEWGKGYATESSLTALKIGFERWDLSWIFARFETPNVASRRVMEKCGMTYWKTHTGEGPCDQYYRITKAQWEAFEKTRLKS